MPTPVEELEYEIMQKSQQLAELRKQQDAVEVKDYTFKTLEGETSLSQLFADKKRLLVIHNMGQGCRYCTLWADGINGFIDHLEDAMSVVLVSKDDQVKQREFALDRGWKFRMLSHGGGEYMTDHCCMGEHKNFPGAATYEMQDGKIMKLAQTAFGPGDLYSPIWHFLSLAGLSQEDWTPQYHYWSRPQQLDDGGENIKD